MRYRGLIFRGLIILLFFPGGGGHLLSYQNLMAFCNIELILKLIFL